MGKLDGLFCADLKTYLADHFAGCEDCRRSFGVLKKELPFVGMVERHILAKARDNGEAKTERKEQHGTD